MEPGTMKERYLETSVLPGQKQKDMAFGPGVGCDYSNIENMITAEGTGATPKLAWEKAFSNFTCSLGKAVGARVVAFLPQSCKDKDLKAAKKQLEACAEYFEIPLVGGQTQVLATITAPIFTITIFGHGGSFAPSKSKIFPGDEIVMAGLTGNVTGRLVIEEKKEQLEGQFSQSFFETALEKFGKNSLKELAELLHEASCNETFGITYLHDVSQGGIYRSLWQLGKFMDRGLLIDNSRILMLQEVVELSERLEENPYLWDGTGAVLIVCRQGYGLQKLLQQKGIPAALLGRVTEDKERIVQYTDGEKRTLSPEN